MRREILKKLGGKMYDRSRPEPGLGLVKVFCAGLGLVKICFVVGFVFVFFVMFCFVC